jgi:hypothetical protein
LVTKEQPAISVKEARKLLGKQYWSFSDEEIANIITLLNALAKDFIKATVPK